ncbi:MAG: FHA domain-containing protein [Pseudolysinimonas sp.]
MAADDSNPLLITPPPGLLPAPKAPADDSPSTQTSSQTRRISPGATPVPAFFPAAPGVVAANVPVDDTPPAETAAPVADAAPPAEKRWVVVLPSGDEHPITAEGVAFGRNPSAPAGWPQATLLSVDDVGRSVSKTHAVFALVDGSVRIFDLASTNGVAVSREGARTAVTIAGAEVPDGSTVELGSFAVGVRLG